MNTFRQSFLIKDLRRLLWNESIKSLKPSLRKPSCLKAFQCRQFGLYKSSLSCFLPMKPGTPIAAVDIYKEKDPVVVLERSEYPEWVGNLAKPLPSLAELRRMPEEDATDKDKMRYLKLTRRMQIKKNNAEMAGQKR